MMRWQALHGPTTSPLSNSSNNSPFFLPLPNSQPSPPFFLPLIPSLSFPKLLQTTAKAKASLLTPSLLSTSLVIGRVAQAQDLEGPLARTPPGTKRSGEQQHGPLLLSLLHPKVSRRVRKKVANPGSPHR